MTNTTPVRPIAEDVPEKWYKTAYVAEIFDVKPATVRKWIETGKIEGRLINGLWRVSRTEVNRFANEKYGEPKEDA